MRIYSLKGVGKRGEAIQRRIKAKTANVRAAREAQYTNTERRKRHE